MNKKANKKNLAGRFLVAGFFVLLFSFSLLMASPAKALINTYNKVNGSQLTPQEWNNLLLDFLNTDGGRVNGSIGINTATSSSYILNVSGGGYFSQPVVVGTPSDVSHAATMGYVNSVITGGAGSTVGYWAMDGININNTNTGNVGIGTTNPVAKLDVSGNVLLGGENIGGGYSPIPSSFAASGKMYVGWNRSSGGGEVDVFANRGGGGTGGFRFIDYSNTGVETPLVTMQGGGNVGIGTTIPGYKLDVNGDLRVTGGSYFDGGTFVKDQSGTADSWWGWYAWEKEFQFNKRNSANGFVQNIFTANWDTGDFVMVPDSGNVGVGNTAPGTKLDVTGSFRNSLATTHTLLGNSGNVVVMADNTGTLYSTPLPTFVSANSLWEGSKNGNIWNGDAGAGNVGIGTTNPSYKLQVAGTILTGTDNNIGVVKFGTGEQAIVSTAGNIFRIQNWGGGVYNDVFYASSGNVGIGTTNPGSKLHLASPDVTNTPRGDLIMSRYWVSATDARASSIFHYFDGSVDRLVFGVSGNGGTNNFNSPDQISLAKMVIGADGNVGIGITDPGTKLDISGSLRNSLATTHSLLGSAGNVVVMADNTGTLYSTPLPTFVSANSLWAGSKNGNIWNGDAGAGNVGIGTTAPGAKLQVIGNYTTSNDTAGSDLGFGQSTINPIWGFRVGASPYNLMLNKDTGGVVSNVMTWDRINGNIGIGTTNPTANLYVNRAAAWSKWVGVFANTNQPLISPATYDTVLIQSEDVPALKLWDAGIGHTGGMSIAAGDGHATISSPNDLRFFVGGAITNEAYSGLGGTQVMQISSGGVGIGITDPGTKLDVSGSLRNSLATTHSLLGAAGNVVVMSDNTGTLYSTPLATFASTNSLWGGTKNGNIWNGDAGVGNVGIGTTAPGNSFKLDIAGGNIVLEQGTTNQASDYSSYNYGIGFATTAQPTLYGPGALITAVPNGSYASDIQFVSRPTSGGAAYTNVTIKNDGSVGINTTTPAYKLDVNGTFEATTNSSSIILDASGNISIGI